MLKVFLGGEGNNELGTRWHRPAGDQPGVIETLLRKVRPTGWHVTGAQDWKSIRKYRAGAARLHPNHEDAHNTLGLVLRAYENACEMLVFVRDSDGDQRREHAIQQAVASIPRNFVEDFRYELAIVGGIAKPNLEGWILCLLGVAGTDEMTPTRVERELERTIIEPKSTCDYVVVTAACTLPTGDASLSRWLALADGTFRRLIDGASAP